jgi:hypothetical protein
MTETIAGPHFDTDHRLLSGCRKDALRKAEGVWEGGEAHDRA